MTPHRRSLVVLLPLLVAACSTTGNYPSLAQRDVERVNGRAEPAPGTVPVPATAPAPASGDLTARLDALVAAAGTADRAFRSDRPAAERAAAAAGGRGSDSWSAASIALARLEASRSRAMTALADLDTLFADSRAAAPTDESPATRAIAAARSQVSDIVAAQDRVIASLSARISG